MYSMWWLSSPSSTDCKCLKRLSHREVTVSSKLRDFPHEAEGYGIPMSYKVKGDDWTREFLIQRKE